MDENTQIKHEDPLELIDIIQSYTEFNPLDVEMEDPDFEWFDLDREKTASSETRKSEPVPTGRKDRKCHICNEIMHDRIRHMITVHKYLPCPSCSSLLPDLESLQDHVSSGHPEPEKCEHCKKTFKNRKLLNKHYSELHSEEDRQCQVCNVVLDNKLMKECHLVTVHKFLKCKVCNNYYSKETLEEHIRFEHLPPFKCKFCEESFPSRAALNQHCTKNHSTTEKLKEIQQVVPFKPQEKQVDHLIKEQVHRCSTCEKIFESKPKLDFHFVQVHGCIQCEFCAKILSQYTNGHDVSCKSDVKGPATGKMLLNQQFTKNPATQETKCNFCDEVLAKETSEEDHLIRTHYFIKCEICDKLYANPKSVKMHKGSMHPIKCDHCEEVFRSKIAWRLHCSDKHATKEQKCKKCDCILSNQSELEIHLVQAHRYPQCHICGLVVARKRFLEEHMHRKHVLDPKPRKLMTAHLNGLLSTNGRKCIYCNEVFENRTALETHLVEIHKYIKCRDCSQLYASDSSLKSHIAKMHPLSCNQCNKNFVVASLLNQHCLIEHSTCNLCNIAFEDKAHRNAHMIDEHNYLHCEVCSKIILSRCYLKKHLQKVHSISIRDVKPLLSSKKLFACEFCKKYFDQKDTLDIHRRAEHPQNCEHCTEVFYSLFSLHRHYLEKHPTLEPPKSTSKTLVPPSSDQLSFQCEICHKVYDNHKSARRHKAFKHPLNCEHCDEVFSTMLPLRKHILEKHVVIDDSKATSRGESPEKVIFQCDKCDKFYEVPNSLRVHKRLKHPAKCEFCDKVCTDEEALRKHCSKKHRRAMRSLKLQKCPTIKCQLCDKVFYNEAKLNRHTLKVHSERKKDKQIFKCEVCDASFAVKLHLRRHCTEKHSTENKKLPRCEHCDQVFKTKRLLSAHLSKQHANELPGSPTSEKSEDSMSVDSIEIGNYECDECSAVFESFHELECHKKEHIRSLDISNEEIKTEQLFQCTVCEEIFELIDEFEKHSKIHIKIDTDY